MRRGRRRVGPNGRSVGHTHSLSPIVVCSFLLFFSFFLFRNLHLKRLQDQQDL
jgi:hypothetical protein